MINEPQYQTMPLKVQWCHGAAGMIPVLVQAYKLFNNATYLEAARLAADFTFEKGILTKGMHLCHGVSGNAYMLLYLY